MSITKTLTNKDLPAEEKLKNVAELVAQARESYGNTDIEVEIPAQNTCYGLIPFTHLEDDSKVEVLLNEAMKIKAKAIAFVEATSGAVLNKKVEELLATNPYFCNVAAGVEFGYL